MRPINSMGIMVAILILTPYFVVADYQPPKSVAQVEELYNNEIELEALESKLILLTRIDDDLTGFMVSVSNSSIYSKINLIETTGFVNHGNKSKIHNYGDEEPYNQLAFIKESPTGSIKLNITSMVTETIIFNITIKSFYFTIDNLDQTRTQMFASVGDDHPCCGDNLDHDYYGAGARINLYLFNSMNTSVELNISSRYNFELVKVNASSNLINEFTMPEITYFENNHNTDRDSWLSVVYITNTNGRVNISYSMSVEDKGTINPIYVSPGFLGYTTPLQIWISIIIFWLVVVSLAILFIYLMVKKASFFKGDKLKN